MLKFWKRSAGQPSGLAAAPRITRVAGRGQAFHETGDAGGDGGEGHDQQQGGEEFAGHGGGSLVQEVWVSVGL